MKRSIFIITLIFFLAFAFSTSFARENDETAIPLPAISDIDKRPGEIDRDDRFIAHENGTVLDTKTGLMWAARNNDKDINWKKAKRYCEKYRKGGYEDWRMPTVDELKALYDEDKENQDGYHITRLIGIDRCCPWAVNEDGEKAAFFDFNTGVLYWGRKSDSYRGRVLPVRGGK